MELLSAWSLVAGLIIGLSLCATLYIVASHLLRAMHVHDLTIEAHRLRHEYARRLDALRRNMAMDVELLDPLTHESTLTEVEIIDEGASGTRQGI